MYELAVIESFAGRSGDWVEVGDVWCHPRLAERREIFETGGLDNDIQYLSLRIMGVGGKGARRENGQALSV